jgi:hypothetical protein
MGPDVLVRTRRSLHGVAETVVASSQFHATGQMQLRSVPAGSPQLSRTVTSTSSP